MEKCIFSLSVNRHHDRRMVLRFFHDKKTRYRLLFFPVLLIFIMSACSLPHISRYFGQTTAPNLTGLPVDHADYYLKQAELAYEVVEQAVSEQAKDNIVLSQLPNPGDVIKAGDTLQLTVGVYNAAADEIEIESIENKTALATVSAVAMDNIKSETVTAEPDKPSDAEQPAAPPQAAATLTGGDSQQLIFASDRGGDVQLWLVDIEGADPIQLTRLQGGACQPDWSPDGSQIVMTSPCDGRHEIYPASSLWLADAGGENAYKLPEMAVGDFDAVWSPDGEKIAFTSMRDSGLSQIYIYDVQHQSVKNISNNSGHELQPAWSPDGSQIAFISPVAGSDTVMIREVSGGEVKQFTRDNQRNFSHPLWSKDGASLIFGYLPSGGVPALMSAALEDQGYIINKLFHHFSMPVRDASISPDGLWVAYESWLDGTNHEIWITRLDIEAEPLKLTRNDSFDFDADWRP